MSFDDYHNLAYWADDDPDDYTPPIKKGTVKMAEMWKPQSFEVYEQWIKAILEEASDELNDWENKFIDSITERVAKRIPLSRAQEEKLEHIYVEKTP